MVNMSDEEKAAAFDKLALCFDYPNFGACSKSDIELCYFSIILDYLVEHKKPYDDYSMSKMFGITQQRVRNLKVKKQLRYGRDYPWEEALISRVKNARFSKDSNTIDNREGATIYSIGCSFFSVLLSMKRLAAFPLRISHDFAAIRLVFITEKTVNESRCFCYTLSSGMYSIKSAG